MTQRQSLGSPTAASASSRSWITREQTLDFARLVAVDAPSWIDIQSYIDTTYAAEKALGTLHTIDCGAYMRGFGNNAKRVTLSEITEIKAKIAHGPLRARPHVIVLYNMHHVVGAMVYRPHEYVMAHPAIRRMLARIKPTGQLTHLIASFNKFNTSKEVQFLRNNLYSDKETRVDGFSDAFDHLSSIKEELLLFGNAYADEKLALGHWQVASGEARSSSGDVRTFSSLEILRKNIDTELNALLLHQLIYGLWCRECGTEIQSIVCPRRIVSTGTRRIRTAPPTETASLPSIRFIKRPPRDPSPPQRAPAPPPAAPEFRRRESHVRTRPPSPARRREHFDDWPSPPQGHSRYQKRLWRSHDDRPHSADTGGSARVSRQPSPLSQGRRHRPY